MVLETGLQNLGKLNRTLHEVLSRTVLCCLFLVSEFRWRFTLRVSISFLLRFGLLSGHILENSCSFGWPYVLFVFWLFVILVSWNDIYSVRHIIHKAIHKHSITKRIWTKAYGLFSYIPFWFWVLDLVLIASVPDLCILFTVIPKMSMFSILISKTGVWFWLNQSLFFPTFWFFI